MHLRCTSDTHNRHDQIKPVPCDLFVHAGDFTNLGSFGEVKTFAKWLAKYPARYKIVTPGNHERQFEKELPSSLLWLSEYCPDVKILINETIDIEGYKIHGFSYTPTFYNWAFMKDEMVPNGYEDTEIPMLRQTRNIPEGLDLLICHGPPKNILDANKEGESCGSIWILDRIMEVRPKKVLFGHLHLSGGKKEIIEQIEFYNVAAVQEPGTIDGPYRVINQPTEIYLGGDNYES